MSTGTGPREAALPGDAGVLERRYRRLLVAYPRGYRAEFGAELLATLLATSEPGRRVPAFGEAVALVRGGLRARIAAAAAGEAWTDGLHLGVTVLCAVNLAALVPYAGTLPVWTGLAALVLLAVLRGWTPVALLLAVPVAGKVYAVAMGHPWLDGVLLPIVADPIWAAPALYSGGPAAPLAGYALVLLGLAVLAVRARPPRRRSWGWWLIVPLLAGTGRDWSDLLAGHSPVRVGLEAALLGLAVWAGRVAADPRWAGGAVAYLTVEFVALAEHSAVATTRDLAHGALLALLTGAAVAVPYRARRRLVL